jgi:uncharacterized protein (TIRG00374 family)
MYNDSMRIRHVFIFIAILFTTILLIVQLGQFQKLVETIKEINLFLLIPVFLLRGLYYWTNTKYFEVYLKNFNHKIPAKKIFNDVVTMNFANTVFPSGGISGIAILRGRFRKHNVSAHTTTVAQAFWLGFTAISFIILLLASLLLLFLSKKIEMVSFRLILILLIFILLGSLVVVALLLNRHIAEKVTYYLTRPTNWLLRKFNKNSLGKEQLHELNSKFYETLAEFKNNWRLLLSPFFWCFATLLIDIASLYLVFVAFGVYPNPGVVIAAFLIALFASVLSIFTSGVGVFEIGMVSILVGLGLGFDISFSASLIYRAIALWLFLPIGFYFYKRTMLDDK